VDRGLHNRPQLFVVVLCGGYIHAHKTSKGQVIELAQFEAIHYLLSGTMVA